MDASFSWAITMRLSSQPMQEAVSGWDSSDLCWLSTWGGEGLYPGVCWALTSLPLTLKEAKAASSGVFALETSIWISLSVTEHRVARSNLGQLICHFGVGFLRHPLCILSESNNRITSVKGLKESIHSSIVNHNTLFSFPNNSSCIIHYKENW